MDAQLIDSLKRRRFTVSDTELDEVEQKLYADALKRDGVFYYNEFRIANLERLKTKRPHILISSRFNPHLPNVHLEPLMLFADVVTLAYGYDPLPYKSQIVCNATTHLLQLLEKLPPGFTPDLFWDQMMEQERYIPKGLEKAPFPTFASVCQMYYMLSIQHICPLFDRVLPVSKQYCALLEKQFPGKIIDLPFGGNWASFDPYIAPVYEKTVDVCVTFAELEQPSYGARRVQLVKKAKAFKEKYGDRYKIEIVADLPLPEYVNLLKRSLITVNIAGIHGPYNFRTVEAMNAGSMLLECNWGEGIFQNQFSALFEEGVHGASFTLDTFEEKLLYYLTHKEEALNIARQGNAFVTQNFTYEKLYSQLIDEAKKVDLSSRKPLEKGLGFFHSDLIYYYQGKRDMTKLMNCGALQVYCEETKWIQANNSLVYLSTLKNAEGDFYPLTLLSDALKKDRFTSLTAFYEEALARAPEEYSWVVEWNYYLVCLQFQKQVDPARILKLLEGEGKPLPERVLFKYALEEVQSAAFFDRYVQLNLDLYQTIDHPERQVPLLKKYASDFLTRNS